jgi:hypothetical protein
MNCEWRTLTAGSLCIFGCGTKLPRDHDEAPVCECRAAQFSDTSYHTTIPVQDPTAIPSIYGRCKHIGSKVGEVKVRCSPNCTSMAPVHKCEIHRRCLPTFRGPWDEEHQEEAKLYHLCHRCDTVALVG